MAGHKKNNPPVKKQPPVKAAPKTQVKAAPKPSNLKLATFILVAICGFLIYANTLGHQFVLDDFSVIAENKITRKGAEAIGEIFTSGYREGNFVAEDNLYRPLTKAMFAVEWGATDGNPALSHFINVLLYGALCGFIFLILFRFLPDQYYLCLIATLLFTFHPIHTEVVANIKSRDEILTLFFILGSLWWAKTYMDQGKVLAMGISALLYFLALFTKESAITYVALLPLTMYFFAKPSMQKNMIITVVMVVVSCIYLLIHKSVIGQIGLTNIPIPDNSLLASDSFGVQRMTAIYILGKYLVLLFFPHPLSSDYSFNTIPLVSSAGHAGFLLALLVHIALLVVAILGLRKKKVYAYAILFYFITLSIVSNVFMLIGTNMAERLVFIPSLGFCLLIAYGLGKLFKTENITPPSFSAVFSKKALVWLVLIPILILATVKVTDRNKDWKNVSTLFNQDVKTVPESVHMLLYHAGMITNSDSLSLKTPEEKAKTLALAEKELLKATSIYEPFPNVLGLLGRVYKEQGQYQKAIEKYKRTLELNTTDPTTYNNYATCFFSLGQYKEAEINFAHAIEISPQCYADALCNLGSVYGTYAELAKIEGRSDEAKKYFDMAIDMFNKTIACDKEYPNAYKFLGATYQNLGDTQKAGPYFQKFDQLMAKKQQQLKKK